MLGRFLKCRSGATAIEYALIVAVVSMAIVGGAGSLGDKLDWLFTDNASELAKALKE